VDKKYRKIIDEAISCLNWDVIVQNYRDYERILGKKKRPTNAESIKNDLRNLCKFIIENNITYFDQDQFVITWRHSDIDFKLGSKLEIMFVPTRSVAYSEEEEYDLRDDEIDSAKMELDTLTRLLESSIEEENYELAAILRDRIEAVKPLVVIK